jgi:hypothetical protein
MQAVIGKIHILVVQSFIRAQCAGQIKITARHGGGDFCASEFGQLNSDGAHTNGTAMNQHMLAGLQFRGFYGGPRGQCRQGQGCRNVERNRA